MGKLFALIVLVALGYAGIYFYYGVAVQQEVEQQLEDRGLSSISVDDVTYGLTTPISTSANIAITVTYRGAQATVDMADAGPPGVL